MRLVIPVYKVLIFVVSIHIGSLAFFVSRARVRERLSQRKKKRALLVIMVVDNGNKKGRVNKCSYAREGKYMHRRRAIYESAAATRNPKITRFLCEHSLINTNSSHVQRLGNCKITPTYRAGPFLLRREPTKADVQLLEYVFSNNLDPSELVVQMKFNDLTRQRIKALMPKEWLNDDVINIVCEMRTNDAKAARDDAELQRYQIVLGRSLNWTRRIDVHHLKERYMSNLLFSTKIFFPMFDEGGDHWFLMVIDMSRGKVEIWDSLPQAARERLRRSMCLIVLQSLDAIFKTEIHDQSSLPFPFFEKLSIVQRTDAPRQQNGHDCGIYVISYMLTPDSLTWPDFKFKSDEQRFTLTLKILKSWMNDKLGNLVLLSEEFRGNGESSCPSKTKDTCGVKANGGSIGLDK